MAFKNGFSPFYQCTCVLNDILHHFRYKQVRFFCFVLDQIKSVESTYTSQYHGYKYDLSCRHLKVEETVLKGYNNLGQLCIRLPSFPRRLSSPHLLSLPSLSSVSNSHVLLLFSILLPLFLGLSKHNPPITSFSLHFLGI